MKRIFRKSCDLIRANCHHSVFRKYTNTLINNVKMASDTDDFEMDISNVKPQPFKYFLVLDFEATCDNNTKLVPQEIIEFPVLKINSRTLQTESIFHQYVQPKVHQRLTPFCTELTGIIQDMVDGQPFIEEVLEKFDLWMDDNGLLDPENTFVFVTCGDWDLKTMLTSQLRYFGLERKPYFNRWINIKKPFANYTNEYPKGMMPMLHKLELSHTGRHHSGIDDCTNIGKILTTLLQRGVLFKVTGKL